MGACAARSGDALPDDRSTAPGAVVRGVRHVFGCFFEFTIFDRNESLAAEWIEEGFRECERIEAATSVWRPDGELVALNRRAAEAPVSVGETLRSLLAASLDLSAKTGGTFDVTVGPVVELYQLRSAAPRLPSAAELERVRERVGYRLVELSGTSVRYKKPGVAIDLDGCNKGFALDAVAARFRRHGVDNAILSAGGSSYLAIGPPPGTRARIVEIADERGTGLADVELRDGSLSTSGNWRRAQTIDGETIGHIVDPRTGTLLRNGPFSATVVAASALLSDALAKTALILGPGPANPILQQLGATAVVWIVDQDAGRIVQRVHF